MILLFDLAGLLLDFRGIEITQNISGGTVDAQKFGRFWSESPIADRLYRGRSTPKEFARDTVAEWQLKISPEEFLSAFQRWLVGPYSGAFELLATLGQRHVLACLSNTNELDCRRFRTELLLQERFHHCFFSNEIGLRKPEPQCYEYVLKELNARSADVIFFDDSLECVEGAQTMGIQAYQCVGLKPLREQLVRLELLDAEVHGNDGG